MKIENQVCTLEQAKKLKELGVTAEPLFWYVIDIDPITPLDIIQKWQHSNFDQCEKYHAFTVAELGVMIDWNHVSQSGPYKEDQHFIAFGHTFKIIAIKTSLLFERMCLSTFWETTSPPLKK